MPSVSELERSFYIGFVGLTEAQAATKTFSELRALFIAAFQSGQGNGSGNKGYVNARDYGAHPTATAAVNRAAINNAMLDMQTAGGGAVYLPCGTYLVNQVVYLRNKVRLYGDGMGKTIIKAEDNPTTTYITLRNFDTINGTSDITVENLTVDHNRQGRPGADGSTSVRVEGGDASRCYNITFRHVESKNAWFGAYQMMNCVNLDMDGCKAFDCLRDGFTIWFNSENVTIRGCKASMIGDDCVGMGSGSGHVGSQVKNVVVSGCTLEQRPDAVHGNGVAVTGGKNVTITGNTIGKTQGWGVALKVASNDPTMFAENVTVTGNLIYDQGRAESGGGGIVVSTGIKYATVQGNIISTTYGPGILVNAKATVVGNSVHNGKVSFTSGIVVAAELSQIIGNQVENMPHYGIQVTGTRCVVQGNVIQDCESVDSGGTYLIVSGSRNVISGNICRKVTAGYGGAGVRLDVTSEGTGNVVTGNIASGFIAGLGVVDQTTAKTNVLANNSEA